ncbi:MAG: type II toxin-antitoxin system VapC family toxin [Promethearchaeota archaeon]
MGIFLDTGFYLGLCHPKDRHAKDSERILENLKDGTYGLLYSSNLIISEATTLAAVRTNSNPEVLNHLGDLFWGKNKIATILHFNADKESETWELFKKININKKKSEKIMSFVDVSSIILCKTHQIDKIVSFDSHFDGFLERIY